MWWSGLSDLALLALVLFPLKLASLEDGSGVTLENAKRVHAATDATSALGLTEWVRGGRELAAELSRAPALPSAPAGALLAA